MAHAVTRTPLRGQATSKPLPSWARFYFYGMHGLLYEIIFTAVFDVIFRSEGNAQLKGYSTVFSFFIYGSCSFFVDRLYAFLYLRHGIRWFYRIPLYLLIVYTWELMFGLILRKFDACSWDYSHYPLNLMGLITLVYAPAWLVLCVYQDLLTHFLLSLRITYTIGEKDEEQYKKS